LKNNHSRQCGKIGHFKVVCRNHKVNRTEEEEIQDFINVLNLKDSNSENYETVFSSRETLLKKSSQPP